MKCQEPTDEPAAAVDSRPIVPIRRGNGRTDMAGGDDRAWRAFTLWCRTRRLSPLPAHPWTVAAYLRWSERRLGRPGINRALAAIARAHLLALRESPVHHPTVARTLRLIEARRRTRALAADLFPAEEVAGDQRRATPVRRRARSRRRLASTPRLVARR